MCWSLRSISARLPETDTARTGRPLRGTSGFLPPGECEKTISEGNWINGGWMKVQTCNSDTLDANATSYEWAHWAWRIRDETSNSRSTTAYRQGENKFKSLRNCQVIENECKGRKYVSHERREWPAASSHLSFDDYLGRGKRGGDSAMWAVE